MKEREREEGERVVSYIGWNGGIRVTSSLLGFPCVLMVFVVEWGKIS